MVGSRGRRGRSRGADRRRCGRAGWNRPAWRTSGRRRACRCARGHSRAATDDRRHRAGLDQRPARQDREGPPSDGRESHRRHSARRRLEPVLLHRRALGIERAAVCRGHSRERRAGLGHPRLRGSASSRADRARRPRSADVAGRREPLSARRADSQGSRRHDRTRRRRRAPPVLRLQRREEGSAGHRLRQRRSGHRGMPDDQVTRGDRADATGERHDHRRLQSGARHASRG